jgi:hypothetical protein
LQAAFPNAHPLRAIDSDPIFDLPGTSCGQWNQTMDQPTTADTLADSSTAVERTVTQKRFYRRPFRRGQWVQVRTEAEIRGTLDADGKLDGLPFMPEQAGYCGHKFRIYRRADRVYLDYHYFVVRLKNTVLLDDLRCDGAAHGGCQMRCLMFWKEAWLRPIDEPSPNERVSAPVPLISLTSTATTAASHASIGETFSCQATELARIGTRLSGWDPRQYLADLYYRERSLGEVLTILAKQARNMVDRVFSRKRSPVSSSKASKPSGARLNLQPGEWIQVKSFDEINATLSSDNRLRGLGFSPDMIPFCGKRFRVASRVERMILEWTGELKQLRDTVALDLVHCDGISLRGCPRNCFFLWREDWLTRVD